MATSSSEPQPNETEKAPEESTSNDEPETKRRRKRASGWDTPAPNASAPVLGAAALQVQSPHLSFFSFLIIFPLQI
jgi:hypothetical protein